MKKSKIKMPTKQLINKKQMIILIVIFLIVIITLIYFFSKNVNKNLSLGNNLSNKTNQEIEEYILNISSYEANIDVQVESNKNTTKYKMKQIYTSPNIEKQVIEEPSNIKGLETVYDGTNLTLKNTKLNLTTVYENYPYLANNFLWLNSFIEDYNTYKNTNGKAKMYEENGMLVMEVELPSQNPYVSYKKLFIDKKTNQITKLVVQDKNKKNLVYILYNEIKINSSKKEEILAFRLSEPVINQY